LVVNIKVM